MSNRQQKRVYIAAASSDIDRAILVRDQLVQRGVQVTSRWISEVHQTGANPTNLIERRRRALNDTIDVSNSSLLLCLVPNAPHTTCGAWWECGYAYALGLPIISSAPRSTLDCSVFPSLGEEFESDDDAINRITEQDPYEMD